MNQENVSVVIVNFNTRECLLKCVGFLPPEVEVLVVDNCSTDGSVDALRLAYPHALIIESKENLGFGRANNLGFQRATRDLILYLNSDAYCQENAISLLASAFADEMVVGAGPRLLNPDGSLQLSTANNLTLQAVHNEQFYIDPILRKFGFGYWNTLALLARCGPGQLLVDTPQVTGACLMVRRKLSESQFSPEYFLYCEDTDLCFRLRKHGRIVFVPEATVIHDLGTSSKSDPWKGIARYNLGKEIFFGKHFTVFDRAVVWYMNRLGALFRVILFSIFTVATLGRVRSFPIKVATFWKVMFTRKREIVPEEFWQF